MATIRVLLLADSHLGFDLPARPRVPRRRRGLDFLANHAAALAPALAGEVDVVVHGGDVFDRPRVSPELAHRAYAPLLRVAEQGVPVFIVPGNHERSRLPHVRLAGHRHLHVFAAPHTYVVEVRGFRVALSGIPFERRNVRARFPELLEQTGWRSAPADVRLLCLHQCVEGAQVGPGDYTFTSAPDVIRARDLPQGFAAVLSGHIHRHQVLRSHLSGRPLSSPVVYPGSVERTSVAELGERKGYAVLELACGDVGVPLRCEFRELPARPMLVQRLVAGGRGVAEVEAALHALIAAAPADAVLRIRVEGALTEAHRRLLSSARLRSIAPATMNVEIRPAAGFRAADARRSRPGRAAKRARGANLDLFAPAPPARAAAPG